MQIPDTLVQFNEFIKELARLDEMNILELIPHAHIKGVYVVAVKDTTRGVQLWLDRDDMVLDYMTVMGSKQVKVSFDIKGLASRAFLFLQNYRHEI
ncbi:hypothetical protein PHABIO_255 [Pseudomonas phage Phabio]|uniref:Uncharacterized protein n=1 Tax=Pseudomonas phage Phabio TaxID=2006668 RepID=A0A1Y0SZ00_9CAUD|nr:hypothetical protein MZD05_gp255 [Pseudomonas phage Phabio]ARV76886.1 hypothetical protein PHABIO_255 [Pseudomonas phage Phabio]